VAQHRDRAAGGIVAHRGEGRSNRGNPVLKRDNLVVRMEYLRDGVDTALDAIDAQDYATAVEILRPLAEQGNGKAIINLALLYSCGWGVPLDARKAAEMYERVGALEIQDQLISAIAYNNLATLYIAEPPGLPRDDEKAARYRELAEKLGLPGDRFTRKEQTDER
jgi:TPR repeat protein